MSSIDLTTLAAVREFLQKSGTETQQDAVVSSLITRASQVIMRWCRREFAPMTSATERIFEWRGRRLDLDPYDIRSVSQIRLDTDTASPVVLASTAYRLWPRPNHEGVYRGIEFLNIDSCAGVWPTRLIGVTGDWGFSAVPEDVAQACIMTVATWLRRDVSGYTRDLGVDVDQVDRPVSLPGAVLHILEPFRRVNA